MALSYFDQLQQDMTNAASQAASGGGSSTQPVPNPPGTPDMDIQYNSGSMFDQIRGSIDTVRDFMNNQNGGAGTEGQWFGPTGDGPGMPTDYADGDPFQFDTRPGDPGPSQFVGYYDGGEGPNNQTSHTSGPHSMLNPDGSVSIAGDVTTREVKDEELVSHQLDKVLNSNSKYMQDARRQGLEQANATGGLGGSVGAGAAMQAAVRAGLPIAQEDAKAFQVAASENMAALNQYAQLNLQRATELENAQIGAATSIKTSQISASVQHSIARMEDLKARDLSRLDAETKLRVEEMNGQIQSRMAAFQYQYNALLNDQQAYADLMKTQMVGQYGLADKELSGQWESYIRKQEALVNRNNNYVNSMMGAYTGMMDQIAALNGTEMDDDARKSAIETIKNGFMAQQQVLQILYPDMPPIQWGNENQAAGV